MPVRQCCPNHNFSLAAKPDGLFRRQDFRRTGRLKPVLRTTLILMDLRTCVELACILEATARKPGNVHCQRDFVDLRYVDFLLSATAIGPVLARTAELGVGRAIFEAISATRAVVQTNTNLGIVLLLAPLCIAIEFETFQTSDAERGIASALQGLSVDDARWSYRAIRMAQPGGLGQADEQDVSAAPTIDLRSAMQLAAQRDSIARQYANEYYDVFEVGLPALRQAIANELGWEEAVVWCQLRLMLALPDTLIARKRGQAEANEATKRAGQAAALLTAERQVPYKGFLNAPCIAELDRWLTEPGAGRNPGTTADLVTASLFCALREGTLR